jgi:stage IV sporulation protein FB
LLFHDCKLIKALVGVSFEEGYLRINFDENMDEENNKPKTEETELESTDDPIEQTPLPKPIIKKTDPPVRSTLISGLFFVLVLFVIIEDMEMVLTILGVLFVHETGHLIAMKAFYFERVRMLFVPMAGAMVIGEKKNASDLEKSVVALAGPIPGIIIGMGIYLLIASKGHYNLLKLSEILLFINVFNLLPLLPLDGGRLIEYLFFGKSILVQMAFMLISVVIMAMYAFWAQSFFILIFPVFMSFRLIMMAKLQMIRNKLKKLSVNLQRSYEEISDEEYWFIRKHIINSINQYKKLLDPDKRGYSNIENKLAVQVEGVLEPTINNKLGILGKLVFLAIWIAGIVLPIIYCAIPILQKSRG